MVSQLTVSHKGAWFSRDPIEERGGRNLYGFLNNNGLRGYDRLGLSPSDFTFQSTDLGPRPPMPYVGKDGQTHQIDGATELKYWIVNSRVALPKKCCWVVWANGRAKADYWWSI